MHRRRNFGGANRLYLHVAVFLVMSECSKVEKTKFHRSTQSLSSYYDLLGYDRLY
jgi:hypothetical protein